MTARPVVITGTDTGVGKTWVSCALITALKNRGLDVLALKPVETGCSDPELEDGVALARCSAQAYPRQALLRFSAPLAPPAAAELEERTIEFSALLSTLKTCLEGPDVVLIEGAGGLLSPLTWTHTILDIAKALDAPLLVVAADRLGMLNQLRLTLSCARAQALSLLSPVVNQPRGDHALGRDLSMGRNARDCLAITDIGSVIPMAFGLHLAAAALRCERLVDQILGDSP